jgi:hypothetical protein
MDDKDSTKIAVLQAELTHYHAEHRLQSEKIIRMEDRINTIFTRINMILGGLALSCILLAINIVLGMIKQ